MEEPHPDNGSGFFCAELLRYLGREVPRLRLSRSRPYNKNDNPGVEQKNHTLVRAYLGHARLETPEQVASLNEIYESMWVYYDLSQPVLHLESKTHEGGRLVRKWGEARTRRGSRTRRTSGPTLGRCATGSTGCWGGCGSHRASRRRRKERG